MSGKVIDKIVKERITVCDICGNEIEEKDRKDDPEYAHNLSISHRKLDRPIDRVKQIKFRWPSAVLNKFLTEREKAETGKAFAHVPVTWYDFHGECLANLVEAAVNLRLRNEAEAAKKEGPESE